MGKRNTTPRAWSPFVGTERLSVVSGNTGGPLIARATYPRAVGSVASSSRWSTNPPDARGEIWSYAVGSGGVGSGGGVSATCSCAGSFTALSRK